MYKNTHRQNPTNKIKINEQKTTKTTVFCAHNFTKVIVACLRLVIFCALKVSEYPFKENKNALNIIQVLLYTHFYNISLNVLGPNL